MENGENWQCPHCDRFTTIVRGGWSSDEHRIDMGSKHGPQYVRTLAVVCPNPECKEVALVAQLGPLIEQYNGIISGEPTRTWHLLPSSMVRNFPEFVPPAIISDYREAALIRVLSPKASATLARRCLQGMIRDFWKVSERNLYLEIEAIKEQLDDDTHAAIDAVREIGNIGAHMEKDINVIVDVDANEAELLLQLIEGLIEDWYIVRHEKQERTRKIKEAAAAKQEARKPPPA